MDRMISGPKIRGSRTRTMSRFRATGSREGRCTRRSPLSDSSPRIAVAFPAAACIVGWRHLEQLCAESAEMLDHLLARPAVHFGRRVARSQAAIPAANRGRDQPHHTRSGASTPAGQLEYNDALWPENAQKLAHVPLREFPRHVLQRDVGVNEIEARVDERPQVSGDIEVVMTVVAMFVQALGKLNHGRRDVDTIDFAKVRRKRLGQSAWSTTKVESPVGVDCDVETLQVPDQVLDLGDAGLEELFLDPSVSALVGVVQNRPERIAPAGLIPSVPQLKE